MKQFILCVLLLCSCAIWFIPETQAGQQERLWYKQSLENGGELKNWLVERGKATEESVSLGHLVHAAWDIANRRGVSVEVPKDLESAFSMQLFVMFLRRHDLAGTPDSSLTWEQFGQIGRLHGGYVPFTQADAERALALASSQLATEKPPVAKQPVAKSAPPTAQPKEEAKATPPTTYQQPTIRKYSPLKLEQFTGPMEQPPEPEPKRETEPEYEGPSWWDNGSNWKQDSAKRAVPSARRSEREEMRYRMEHGWEPGSAAGQTDWAGLLEADPDSMTRAEAIEAYKMASRLKREQHSIYSENLDRVAELIRRLEVAIFAAEEPVS